MSDLSVLPKPPAEPARGPNAAEATPYSVSGLGSCRIMGPLRDLESRQLIGLNQSGISGYAHSSAEVLSQFRHMQAQSLPPSALLPLVAPGMDPETLPEAHAPSDFYVFEISSAKQVRIEGHPVQLNYLNKHFADFFSDVDRTRAFWAQARACDTKQMAQFLRPLAAFKRLCEADQALLLGTQMTLVSTEELCRDIDALRMAAPDHLFVTHFDAVAEDGQLLQARAKFLNQLRSALTECGVRWYDPTAAVAAFGQDITLDDNTRSLSHYAPSFETYLGSRWWDEVIRPLCRERRLDLTLREKIKERAIERAATAAKAQGDI